MSKKVETTTIAALATAPQPAGIAIIRVSGRQTQKVLAALFRSSHAPVDEPRKLILGDIVDYKTGEVIDRALAVYMPNPYSFTGEDVCEFQFHGSPALVQKILQSIFSFGISPAEPGEFTKRAFLNGKLDLVQAEAIAELISATSEQALKIAGEHLEGKLTRAIELIGEPIRDALAEIEAMIDFPEEGISPKKRAEIETALKSAASETLKLSKTYNYGHVVREGFRVLLCGRPNVGKSSILNLVLGKERAIVTEISGTTRDLIEECVNIKGFNFIFCDSAGFTDTQDKVERIGVELARERVPWADLVLFVADATDSSHGWENVLGEIRTKAKKIWMVTNKIDLNPGAIGTLYCDSKICAQNFYISAKTKDGLDSLVDSLVEEVKRTLPLPSEASHIVTSERQKNALENAATFLKKASKGILNEPLEIVSIDIRGALKCIEEIIGKTYNEDILGRIFSKFCIGK